MPLEALKQLVSLDIVKLIKLFNYILSLELILLVSLSISILDSGCARGASIGSAYIKSYRIDSIVGPLGSLFSLAPLLSIVVGIEGSKVFDTVVDNRSSTRSVGSRGLLVDLEVGFSSISTILSPSRSILFSL